ncbi:MAG: hypothetical protein PVI23_14455 [Maricaulaceae bacterium]|jgi:hypothetical protein
MRSRASTASASQIAAAVAALSLLAPTYQAAAQSAAESGAATAARGGRVLDGSSFDGFSLADAWLGPVVGVERSTDFRRSDPGRIETWQARLTFASGERTLDFGALMAEGHRAFHLTVYADPEPGRYARGGASQVAALRQPGLKVVNPEGPRADAPCFTLMTCLSQLDAASRVQDGSAPLVVVIEAREPPAAETRLGRVADGLADRFGAASPPGRPDWSRLALEVETALGGRPDPRRLVLVASGAAGVMPGAGAPFLIDGRDAVVIPADAPLAEAETALASGAFAIVLGADWHGEESAARLGPMEAAGRGAHVIFLTQDAAREEVPEDADADRNESAFSLCRGPCRFRRHTAPTRSSAN